MSDNAKGLHVEIYESKTYQRPNHFGKMGGHFFAGFNSLTVVGIYEHRQLAPLPRNCQIFEGNLVAPPAILVVREMYGERIVSVAPPLYSKRPMLYMAGGALVDSSDSRWRELVGFYGGVILHDRYESE
jgi:hypothetical protein